MLASQQFCVKWNSYTTNLQNVFPRLLSSEHFVDLTLACEGRMIKCHKVVLSACSTYFEKLLVHNPCQHPIIFMKDMKHWEVQALVDFMYKGEVNVSQDELNSLLEAAEALQIRGLCGSDQSTSTAAAVARSNPPQDSGSLSTATPSDRDSPPAKRPRRSADEDDSGGTGPVVDSGLTERERSSNGGAACEKKDIKQEPDTDDNFAETEVDDERQDDHYANHEPQDDSDSKDPPPSPMDLPGPSGQSIISSHHAVNSEKSSTDLGSALALQNVMCVLKPQQQAQMQQSIPQFAAILPAPSGNSSLSNSADSKDISHISAALQHSTPTVRVRRSEEELQKAAECVQKGMTFQNVSDIFNIPISTIRFYMARRGILPQRRRGRVSNSGASPVVSPHAQAPSYMLLHYKLPDMGQGQQQLSAPGQVHLQQQQQPPQQQQQQPQQQQQQTSGTVTVPTTASSGWKASDN